MKRFFNWLSARMGKRPQAAKPALPRTSAPKIRKPVKARPAIQPDVEFDAVAGGKIIDGGPGKNILIRNKYVREDSGTHETLKIVDDSILESDEEFGLDPYNTGRFDRSRSWDTARTRK